MKNILIIRFSSIGDIVLTEPLIRCLKKKYPEIEITFLTKVGYKPLLENNSNITRIITINKKAGEALEELRKIDFDLILDLHKNYRSTFIKLSLGIKSVAFFKSNLKKWRMVRLKTNEEVKPVALRYIDAANSLNIEYDHLGVDFYLPPNINLQSFNLPEKYIVLVIGGKYKTKCMPPDLINKLIPLLNLPVVILGGKDELTISNEIILDNNKVVNLTNQSNLLQSAAIIEKSQAVISNDTGLMHITSALKKPMAVVWGNTTPKLGFAPFYPNNQQHLVTNFEVEIACRPCSKLGFTQCPKQHFNCMNLQSPEKISAFINSVI
ncbi:MAG: glycosyltransferase family 9 protein [Bacteroidia bacterium]|nr:glycosyltransferase family 9 protein [Bacteroidia bacterium]